MAVFRLEDRAGTHKNKLPLSVELQNALDSKGMKSFCMGVVYNANGRGVKRLLGIDCGAKKLSSSSAVTFYYGSTFLNHLHRQKNESKHMK